MNGNISEMARWQSTQWVQVPADGFFAAPWHGNNEALGAADTSVDSLTVVADTISAGAARADMADIGMTAAMAPEAGSHTIIQIRTSLRREPMNMRQG